MSRLISSGCEQVPPRRLGWSMALFALGGTSPCRSAALCGCRARSGGDTKGGHGGYPRGCPSSLLEMREGEEWFRWLLRPPQFEASSGFFGGRLGTLVRGTLVGQAIVGTGIRSRRLGWSVSRRRQHSPVRTAMRSRCRGSGRLWFLQCFERRTAPLVCKRFAKCPLAPCSTVGTIVITRYVCRTAKLGGQAHAGRFLLRSIEIVGRSSGDDLGC
jgi:hypothetical protein